MFKKTIIAIGLFGLYGCQSIPQDKETKSYLFPVPTNNYQVGDVVSVFIKPVYKISAVARPDTANLLISDNKLSISSVSERNFKLSIATSIDELLALSLTPEFRGRSAVTLTNVRTVTAFQEDLRNVLASRLSSNPSSCAAMKDNLDENIRMDVIETIIYANFDVAVYNSAGAKIKFDPESIQKLNANLDLSLKNTSDGTLKGESLGFGYITNPRLAKRIFSEVCK